MLIDRGYPVQAVEYRQATPREAVVEDRVLNDT